MSLLDSNVQRTVTCDRPPTGRSGAEVVTPQENPATPHSRDDDGADAWVAVQPSATNPLPMDHHDDDVVQQSLMKGTKDVQSRVPFEHQVASAEADKDEELETTSPLEGAPRDTPLRDFGDAHTDGQRLQRIDAEASISSCRDPSMHPSFAESWTSLELEVAGGLELPIEVQCE